MRSASGGSEEAFGQLFYRYKDGLHRLVKGFTGSAAMADDVLQEVFVRIWIHKHRLQGVGNFPAYLAVVTRRVLLNELRHEGRMKKYQAKAAEESGGVDLDSIEDRLQHQHFSTLIQKGAARLSPQQAAVFRLVKLQGMTRNEAAEALGISPESVKTHLERAMRNMRAFLLRHVDDPLLLMIAVAIFSRSQ